MMTAKQILIDGLKAMGADGLCNRDGQCGCGICDLAPPGDCINIEMCEAAKFIKPRSDDHGYWDEYPDGYYTPIQKDARIADQEAYIERLEAAFLEAKSRLIQVTENKSNPCGLPLRYTASERNAMAREALEELRHG